MDTNTLYYYSHFSINNQVDFSKLTSEINQANNLYVSSISIYEIVNYYRNKAAYLRRLACFMKTEHIQILQQNLLPLNSISIDTLQELNQKNLKVLYNSIMPNKIKFEVNYTNVILNLLIFSYLYFYTTDKNPVPIDKFSDFFYNMATIVRKVNLEVLNDLYVNGYKTNDCDTYIKNSFYDLLEFNLQEYASFLEPLTYASSDLEFDEKVRNYNYDQVDSLALNIRKKIRNRPTSIKYLSSFMNLYEKGKGKGTFDAFLNQFIYKNTDKISSNSLKWFVNDSIEVMIKSGCAFWKNDISDRLIFDQLCENRVLVTFDENAKKFLKKHADKSNPFSKSYELSNYLLK